jgi:uncharacterized membrane protein YdbT with pleckstrin-like domain
MGYIDKTLGSNEKVLYRARIHFIFYIRLWALFFAMTGLIAWLKLEFGEQFVTPLALVLLALSAHVWLRLILPLWTLEIALTNARIVMKRGLIRRLTHELQLKAIEEVNLRQSLLGRILGYGTLDVRGIGDVDDLILEGVSDPLTFRKEIASVAQRLEENGVKLPRSTARDAAADAGDI